ncbi:MAG: insulinase family protein, partial [Deltaproteobacteria bacterium]|nr:insulinase family protein [Deltaproteobacteria bacterium]
IGTLDYHKEKVILQEIDNLVEKMGRAPAENRLDLQQEMDRRLEKARQYQVPGEFDRLYSQAGEVGLNASTSTDVTSYHVTLPRGRMEFWAAMERERMIEPVFREFYAERDVVLRERAQRVDASDKGKLFEELLLHAFSFSPYRYPVIGIRAEIEQLTRQDLKDFYALYYTPENMVVAIVGGFDPLEAKRILHQYFADIPSSQIAEKPRVPEPIKTHSIRIVKKSEEEPQLIMSYLKPTLPHIDDTCFDVIQEILIGGKTARLTQRLVTQKRIASSVDTYNGFPGARFDNLFMIIASPFSGVTNQELQDAIKLELYRLHTEPVDASEIERAKRRMKKSILLSLETDIGAAGLLSYFELLAGDYRYMYDNLKTIESITPDMIMECSRTYLREANEVIASLEGEP